MKRKFSKILGVGLTLALLASMLVMAAPVSAASAVTDVWLEFPGDMSGTTDSIGVALDNDGALNVTSSDTNMIVHFTATNPLKANIDTISIWFPDGSTELSGTTGTTFTSISNQAAGSQLICVDPDGSGSTYGYHDITTAAIAAHCLKVTTPIDIAAGASPYIFIAEGTGITTSSAAGSDYKIKVETSQDTTRKISPAFALGATAVDIDTDVNEVTTLVPLTTTAGSETQFTFGFDVSGSGALTAGTDTVTVIFPAGTDVPGSIATDKIQCQRYTSVINTGTGGSDWQTVSASTVVTVNSDARMVTFTVPVAVEDSKGYQVKFKNEAGISLPEVITEQYDSANYAWLDYYIYTSADPLMVLGKGSGENGNFKISPKAANKLGFDNDPYPGSAASPQYSADCAIVNGFTDALYLQMQDEYGNLVYSGTGSTATVTLSATAGYVYASADTTTSTAPVDLVNGEKTVYFRATTATGSPHTITATSGSYSGTWDVTVAPAVKLYYAGSSDPDETFAPTTTDETPTVKGGSYIIDAISAAVAGDTIKLGEGIYDLTTTIGSLGVDKAITIEAVSGTTPVLRCTGTPVSKPVSITAGATLDGLTFRGLRWTTEFNGGFISVRPAATTGPTIKNCTFEDFIAQYGGVYLTTDTTSAMTSGLITTNIFQNIGGAGCNNLIHIEVNNYSLSGLTISDNTFTNNTGHAISITGAAQSGCTTLTCTGVTISGNTISSNRANDIGIDICNGWGAIDDVVQIGSSASPIKVINNEVSGAKNAGIRVQGGTYTDDAFSDDFVGVVIKRNYVHDNAGPGIEVSSSNTTGSATADIATAVEIMYNDIVDNAHTSGTYGIYNNLKDASADAKVTAKYNWFGDASGPTVSSNVGGTGDTVSSYVDYSPWLYKSKTDVVTDNISYPTFRRNLAVGWNTLSVPAKLISTADALDELIPSAEMSIAYKYAGGWVLITTGVINPLDAIYVKMDSAQTVLLKVDGAETSAPSRLLAEGWNMIGLANLADMDEYAAVASVDGSYSQLVSPSMNTDEWVWIYDATDPDSSTVNDMLVGEGYWIFMKSEATLGGFSILPLVPDLN